MTKGESIIICGDCEHKHTPSLPPKWEYTKTKIRGLCVDCGGCMIEVGRKR